MASNGRRVLAGSSWRVLTFKGLRPLYLLETNMFAITFIDQFNKKCIIQHADQFCIFKSKDAAVSYESKILTPRIKRLLDKGHPTSGGWIKQRYKPLTQESIRHYNRMIETMLIEPLTAKIGKTK